MSRQWLASVASLSQAFATLFAAVRFVSALSRLTTAFLYV